MTSWIQVLKKKEDQIIYQLKYFNKIDENICGVRKNSSKSIIYIIYKWTIILIFVVMDKTSKQWRSGFILLSLFLLQAWKSKFAIFFSLWNSCYTNNIKIANLLQIWFLSELFCHLWVAAIFNRHADRVKCFCWGEGICHYLKLCRISIKGFFKIYYPNH